MQKALRHFSRLTCNFRIHPECRTGLLKLYILKMTPENKRSHRDWDYDRRTFGHLLNIIQNSNIPLYKIPLHHQTATGMDSCWGCPHKGEKPPKLIRFQQRTIIRNCLKVTLKFYPFMRKTFCSLHKQKWTFPKIIATINSAITACVERYNGALDRDVRVSNIACTS